MNLVFDLTLGLLALTGLLCLIRLVRGSSVPDRAVALDTLVVTIVSSVAVASARTGEGTYLDLIVVAALLGFVATALVARFIERTGA